MKESKQIKTKQRVADHGEVFTAEREVKAMCDLVKCECERIESRFLEPACGDGNFLVEVLARKLASVAKHYGKSSTDYEKWSVIAVMNLYGVDLLADNVQACRDRLYAMWEAAYRAHCAPDISAACCDSVRSILACNILCGDALSLKQATGEPIIFAEWAFVTGSQVKRRDFRLDEMIAGMGEEPTLDMVNWTYDEELKSFVPLPVKDDYPLTDYRRLHTYD